MVNRNVQQRNRAAFYQMKREYGGRIDFYKQGTVSSDAKTGQRTVNKTKLTIDHAVILPADVARKEIRGISLISANKSLVSGGGYDSIACVFIIDQRDVPNLIVAKDDWIVHEHKKFVIDHFEAFELGGWIIAARALLGEVPEQIFDKRAKTSITLSDTSTETP